MSAPVYVNCAVALSRLCIGLGAGSAPEKFLGGGGGDTVKIASAPGPDHLILN